MSRYETEEEQVEAIKKWWDKNGTQLLSGILVIVIAVGGWRYWQSSQYTSSANASAAFEQLQMNSLNGTFAEVSREALKLMQEEPKSPYAAGAALLHAKYSYDKDDVDTAVDNLNWVLNNSADKALKVTAYTRLARIYADQQKFNEAQQQLDSVTKLHLNGVEQGNVDYIAAMIALQQGNHEQAFEGFTKVVKNPKTEKSLLGLAQIQLDDLSK